MPRQLDHACALCTSNKKKWFYEACTLCGRYVCECHGVQVSFSLLPKPFALLSREEQGEASMSRDRYGKCRIVCVECAKRETLASIVSESSR